jgi:hypothetical protein
MFRWITRAATKPTATPGSDRRVAVHEAGHAVARVLLAKEMGIDPYKAVSYIEVHEHPVAMGDSIDGNAAMSSQAVTFGPMFSDEIQKAMGLLLVPGSSIEHEAVVAGIARARDKGADIDGWLDGRLAIALAGSAAEARYLKRPMGELLNAYEAEGDIKSAADDAFRAGLTAKEAIEARVGQAAAACEGLFNLEGVWQAVLAVADAIPAAGRVDGDAVADIVAGFASFVKADRPD